MTIGKKFATTKGRPAGFDYMRLLLAVSVVCWHTVVITYGFDYQVEVWTSPKCRLLIGGILPAFFTLSGFLVAGSLERSKTLGGFLYLRVIRIFPALIVEVTLSALVLGLLATSLPYSAYFHHPEFISYFLNVVGDMHYSLPGVFDNNPYPSIINRQLWTVPYELECYISLSVLAFIGVINYKKVFAALIGLALLYGVYKFLNYSEVTGQPASGRTLVLCFLAGVLFYWLRDRIPYRTSIGVLAIALSLVCFWLPGGTFLAPLPVAYSTVYLGLLNPRRISLLETGDYSYGIFLYGFPIQQAVVATGLLPANGWVTLAASIPFVACVAFLSWHLWEKRMLGLRKYRTQVDAWFAFTAPRDLQRMIVRGREMFGPRPAP